MKRRLTLKSEHLTELTSAEMSLVAGGKPDIPSLDNRCLTGMYPSINMPCPTIEAQCPIAIERTPLCPTEL
jgi:hypothetical protein